MSRFPAAGRRVAVLMFAGLLLLAACDRASPPAALEPLGTLSALQPAEPRVNSVIRRGPDQLPVFESRGAPMPVTGPIEPDQPTPPTASDNGR